MRRPRSRRLGVALGGNAIAESGEGFPSGREQAIAKIAEELCNLIVRGYEVVVTHGNGPQVGELLKRTKSSTHVRGQMALDSSSMDSCVAQTQGSLGYFIISALENAIRRNGSGVRVAGVITRVVVSLEDGAWRAPTKAIGSFLSEEQARRAIARGERVTKQALRFVENGGSHAVIASLDELGDAARLRVGTVVRNLPGRPWSSA